MRLTRNDVKEILLSNPTKPTWTEAVLQSKKLQMHLLGVGLKDHIKKIDVHESEKSYQLRKKYGKTNRDLFARALRPLDNIWSGRGGGVFYNTSKTNDEKLRQILANVWNDYSVRDWVRNFWKPRYFDDPQSLIFIETGSETAYPTYKSSRDIFDALIVGRRLEYVVFRTEDPLVYRVVDDGFDQMVKVEGETVTFLRSKENPVFVNWLGRVPAIIVSDIPRDGQVNAFASPIADEVELADIMLREGSISSIYRFKHGFPKSWKYPEVCGKCKGNKSVDGQPCPDCNASGVKLYDNPADVSVHQWPTKEEPEIREKGGFISPDLEYLKYADECLEILEEKIILTHWGTHIQRDKNGSKETATGRFIDIQPVNNRLTLYAKAAESIEEFITNQVAAYHFNSGYKGATVNLGRRFLLEGPDVIWTKYEKARKEGAPMATLDDMLVDYYETKFQGNEIELQTYVKLMKIEPLVHLSLIEAKDVLPYFDFMKKTFYPEWVTTLSNIEILGSDLVKLRASLEAFTKDKIKTQIPDPAAPAVTPPKKNGTEVEDEAAVED